MVLSVTTSLLLSSPLLASSASWHNSRNTPSTKIQNRKSLLSSGTSTKHHKRKQHLAHLRKKQKLQHRKGGHHDQATSPKENTLPLSLKTSKDLKTSLETGLKTTRKDGQDPGETENLGSASDQCMRISNPLTPTQKTYRVELKNFQNVQYYGQIGIGILFLQYIIAPSPHNIFLN